MKRDHHAPMYRCVARNIDTLEVNVTGYFYDGVTEFLTAMQAAAIEERDALGHRKEPVVETTFTLAGQPLLIKPYGANKGMWKWLLFCPGASFDIGEGQLNGIVCQVRLSSELLWEFGYREAWEHVKVTLSELGDFLYQPSEVHLCADMAGKSAATLRQADFIRRGHVTRWHIEDAMILDIKPSGQYQDGRETHEVIVRYGQQETVNFSLTAPHAAVVYDKPREIRVKSRDKLWMQDIWIANGWDGEAPISRVEMRYERSVLHEMGIETMPELFDRLDSLWQYSTQLWLRHTVPNGDKKRSRWPTSTWWKAVQAVVFEHLDRTPGVRDRQRAYHKGRLVSTVLGYLESLMAWEATMGEVKLDSASLQDMLKEVTALSHAHYQQHATDFLSEVIAKTKKIGCSLLKEQLKYAEREQKHYAENESSES